MNPAAKKPANATISALLAAARTGLHAAPATSLDAELLLAHVLGQNRSWLRARPELVPPAAVTDQYFELLEQRAAGQPLAYLTGNREFWSLKLQVNEHTLVPRPETELLVELALARSGDAGHIIELGTGSGAVALALASELPQASITATDIAEDALTVARANAAALNLDVEFVQADWLQEFASACADIIVSNPPYVRDDDPHLLGDGVCAEPRLALVSGADGLDAIRQIVPQAARCLRPGGWLLLEHGHEQDLQIQRLMLDAGLRDIATHVDAAGNPRVTLARR